MAVVLGRQISMTCGESANDSSVQWKFQLLGDFEERFIFNGYKIFQEFSEFHAVVDGRFRLSTVEAQVKHIGTYFCIRITGHHTETYSAKLTVLGKILFTYMCYFHCLCKQINGCESVVAAHQKQCELGV